jgi:hypothetical protein
MEDPFVSTGFSIVTEEAASQEDKRVGFASVTREQPVRQIGQQDLLQ